MYMWYKHRAQRSLIRLSLCGWRTKGREGELNSSAKRDRWDLVPSQIPTPPRISRSNLTSPSLPFVSRPHRLNSTESSVKFTVSMQHRSILLFRSEYVTEPSPFPPYISSPTLALLYFRVPPKKERLIAGYCEAGNFHQFMTQQQQDQAPVDPGASKW